MRTAGVLGAIALLLGALIGPADAVQATALPGGMSRFVVAIGGLRVSSRENWVRLADYSFTSSGTVSESHFHWSQTVRVVRSSTGVQAANCGAHNCVTQTANGFQATSRPDHLSGTYTVSGSTLSITWDGNGSETWQLSQPISGKLAMLTYQSSTFGATHGYGYGSNAAWSTRASMATIANADWTKLKHDFHLWKTDAGTPYLDEGAGNPFWARDWQQCSSNRCLGTTTGSGATQYYLSTANTTSTDRRDTIWHWRTELAGGKQCYGGNSHVKPMLQIIDSDGGFHGWVAVEASISQTSPEQGANADDIGVFQISEFG